MISWFKSKPQIIESNSAPSIEFIKRHAKILFVDDQKVPLIETLIKEGWHIESRKDVDNLRDLESGNFDLIFLDIGGVGTKFDSKHQGFAILKRIKETNPSVLVVAYSGQSFDFEKSEFFKLADDCLSKSSGALQAIDKIESLLINKWTPKSMWQDSQKILKQLGANKKQIDEIQKLLNKNEVFELKKISQILKDLDSGNNGYAALISMLSKLASIIATIIQVCAR